MAQAIRAEPLSGSSFGVCLHLDGNSLASQLEREPAQLVHHFDRSGGLLVIRGVNEITEEPMLLVRLSYLFGAEVEDYRQTLTSERFFHDQIPQVLVLSNQPPCNHAPPPRPEPAFTLNGSLPVQFPHRRGWHTDQSYRRPPPDISLLYGVTCPPSNEGQTLYADCTRAYEELDDTLKRRIGRLHGIHSPSWIGRSARAVREGETPKPLLAHQLPQHHPLVRIHPLTGRAALYLCEDTQMDFVDGPIAGLEPGPDGEGARLLYELLSHITCARYTYIHEWQEGDLVIGDNRCLIHSPTWYNSVRYARLMWRTTVMGNAGAEYANEKKSWLSAEGYQPMHGMEDA